MKGILINQDGPIFGLNPTDLNDEQLNKIQFPKLVDLVELDPRIIKIVADKLNEMNLGYICHLTYKYHKFMHDQYFCKKYNEFYRNRGNEIHPSWNKCSIVFWEVLDNPNRFNELQLFINGKNSIINDFKFDYNWCWNYDKETTRNVANRIISSKNYSSTYNSIEKFTITAPKELYLEFLPKILRQIKAKKYSAGFLLLNEHTPEVNIIQALRSFSTRTQNLVGIKAKLTKEILQKIPPVMRLNALEQIMNNKENYSALRDIDEKDFASLVFGTTIKYPQRVERLLKIYKRNMEQQ